MRTLGFDPSLTNFGWALYDDTQDTCNLHGRFATPASQVFVDRYILQRERVRDLIQQYAVRRIGVESPVFGASYSEGMYGLFLFTCEAFRAEKCDVVMLSPGQGKAVAREFLKRPDGWVMGKGDMVEAAKAATGTRMNHNEADGFWIARTASRFWAYHDGRLKAEDLTETERHQFTRTHTYKRGKHAGETTRDGLIWREGERVFLWSIGPSARGQREESLPVLTPDP